MKCTRLSRGFAHFPEALKPKGDGSVCKKRLGISLLNCENFFPDAGRALPIPVTKKGFTAGDQFPALDERPSRKDVVNGIKLAFSLPQREKMVLFKRV
jgi:hypothetical protein